jgi:hypothetical protein
VNAYRYELRRGEEVIATVHMTGASEGAPSWRGNQDDRRAAWDRSVEQLHLVVQLLFVRESFDS